MSAYSGASNDTLAGLWSRQKYEKTSIMERAYLCNKIGSWDDIPTYDILLDEQRRGPPEWFWYTSEVVYKNKVKNLEKAARIFKDGLIAIDNDDKEQWQTSATEARQIDQICEHLCTLLEVSRQELSDLYLAIFSPYAKQCELIKQTCGIVCFTLDSSQGREKPITIVSLGDGGRGMNSVYSGFLVTRRMNV